VAVSPTQRALAELKRRGWTAQVVERWNQYARVRVDLFGCIDIVAIDPASDRTVPVGPIFVRNQGAAIVGIQVTASAAHHAHRRAKILAEPRMRQWVEAGGRLELWSWSKKGKRGKRKRWELRVERYEDMKR